MGRGRTSLLTLALLLAPLSATAADAGAGAVASPAPAATRALPLATPPKAQASAAPKSDPAKEPKGDDAKTPEAKNEAKPDAKAEKAVTPPTPAKPAEAKVAQKPAPKPAAPAKGVTKKAASSKAPARVARATRVPDAAARRQVAGGATAEDAVSGAESPELATLREVERELFPSAQLTTDVFAALPASTGRTEEAGPRVFATGLPATSSRVTSPAAEGTKDLSFLTGLVLPELPIRWEPRLVRYLEFFRDDPRGRATMSLWLRRSGRYAETLRKTLRKKGVPEDLMWLSMIESGFDPTIRSPAGAVGLWQFMADTGRQYGLSSDRWLDRRMSVQSATEAAAEFLADLHKRFGSWELAMAAYNMGYGGLLVVVRKYNSNDYWNLSQLEGALPWETTLYVPKILAAAIVARNPQRFGYGDLTMESAPDVEDVFVAPGTPLTAIAKAANVTVKDLEVLNPELRAGRAPPLGEDDAKTTTFPVKVPAGKAQNVLANLQKQKREETPLERYVVRFGEALDAIATARGTTTARLSELNAIAPGEVLRGGTVLLVPRAEKVTASAGASSGEDSNKPPVVVPADVFVYPDRKRVFYRVTPGDSLRDVAAAFSVSVDDIRRWNTLDPQGRLHEGMTLQVFVPEGADLSKVVSLAEGDVRPLVVGSDEFFAHFESLKGRKRLVLLARAGDTLESMGKKYGLSVASMERINRRGRGETLKEGDKVVVYASETVATPSNAQAKTSAAGGANAMGSAAAHEGPALSGVSGPEPLGALPPAPMPERLPKGK